MRCKLCGAERCCDLHVDGELIHLATGHGSSSEALETTKRTYPMPPAEAARPVERSSTEQSSHVTDVSRRSQPSSQIPTGTLQASAIAPSLAVPMLRDGDAIGAIIIRRRRVQAVLRQADRAAQDLRRSSRDRDRERTVVPGAAGTHAGAGALGRAAALARRGQPGGQFDARPASRCSRRSWRTQCSSRRPTAASSTRPTRMASEFQSARDLRSAPGSGRCAARHTAAGRRRRDRAGGGDACSGADSRFAHRRRLLGRAPAHQRAGWLPCAAGSTAAARRTRSRQSVRFAQGGRRVSARGRRAAADLRRAVDSGDPERAPVPRDRAEEPRAGDREPAQVAVPRQHEPRAAHAAQCDPRLHRADRRSDLRRGARRRSARCSSACRRADAICSASSTTCSTCPRSRPDSSRFR